MSLTNRFSLFFLTFLAVVLCGFSLGLYGLARWSMLDQIDQRLTASLNSLVAAVEIEPDGVEWNRGEHQLALIDGHSDVCWMVMDPQGHRIDGSMFVPGLITQHRADDFNAIQTVTGKSEGRWRLVGARVRIPQATLPPATPSDSSVPLLPAADGDGDDVPEYPELRFIAGLPLGPTSVLLSQLATLLTGLSAATWLAAALLGRWIGRRALLPIRQLSAAASEVSAGHGDRLPVPETGDELADLGHSFNSLLDRLEETFDRQRRFTGDASHQLRTPLTALLGQIDVALKRERGAAEYRETLVKARTQTRRLQEIVESLLFLSRSDAEGAIQSRDELDLKEWFAAFQESMAGHPRAADLQFECDRCESRMHTHGILLSQLLSNLVDNALKYSPIKSEVVVRALCRTDSLTLEVLDHGQGISDADAPFLFRPFFRSADARRRGIPGTGLGLAVVGRIAECLDASVTWTRNPGGGTIFRVTLPSNQDFA